MAAYCPSSCPKTFCVEKCIKCKYCCKKQKVEFEVEIPNCAVAAAAQLTGADQAFSNVATTVLFNNVLLNETCFRPCPRCRCDPCRCSKRSKKCGCSNSCGCSPCQPYPYPGTQCEPVAPWWCQFYNPTTGLATVPPEGGGLYIIVASLETDSANVVTAEIQINNIAIASKTFGGANTTTALSAFYNLQPGQVIRIVVTDSVGAANLIAGVNTRLDIARLKY